MRGYRPGIVSLMLLLLPAIGWLSSTRAQATHLLVLSEIEERIAGELAVVLLEQHLAQRGLRLVPDDRVSRVGRRLAAQADRPHLAYTFAVIEGDLPPRAFSLPGGHVFVSRALLEQVCQADADLAFVLGHEIAHSALRHYADYTLLDGQHAASVRDALRRQPPLSLFAGNSPASPAARAASAADVTDGAGAAVVVEQVLLPYLSRIRQVKEFEADQFGALYALRAGYDFSGSVRVLQRLRHLYGEDFELEELGGLFQLERPAESTAYPALSERLEQLEFFRIKAAEVARLFPVGRDALDRGDYREAALVFESILALFPQSRTARIGLGVAYHLRYWDSAPGDDFLLAYPGALELEHLYLLERGPRDADALHRALDQYQQVLAAEPGNSYARNNLGVAWAELQQPAQAEHALREALRVAERDFTLFNLGLLLARQAAVAAGDASRHALRAEALALMTQYLRQTPHDAVAAQHVRELQTQTTEK